MEVTPTKVAVLMMKEAAVARMRLEESGTLHDHICHKHSCSPVNRMKELTGHSISGPFSTALLTSLHQQTKMIMALLGISPHDFHIFSSIRCLLTQLMILTQDNHIIALCWPSQPLAMVNPGPQLLQKMKVMTQILSVP